MIDVLSKEEIKKLLELRRKKYEIEPEHDPYIVLTPRNHLFYFDCNSDLSLDQPGLLKNFGLVFQTYRDEKVMKTYKLKYSHETVPYISYFNNSTTIRKFYRFCINNSKYLFFLRTKEEANELTQELQHRGLI